MTDVNRQLNFWKPYQGSGYAVFFDYNPDRQKCFLAFMPESDSGWDRQGKFQCQLGQIDLGEMLTVLQGVRDGLGQWDSQNNRWKGLFHKSGNENDNSIIGFNYSEDKNNNRNLYLSLSVSRGGDKKRGSIRITPGEAQLIRVYLESILQDTFRTLPRNTNDTNTNQGNENDSPF